MSQHYERFSFHSSHRPKSKTLIAQSVTEIISNRIRNEQYHRFSSSQAHTEDIKHAFSPNRHLQSFAALDENDLPSNERRQSVKSNNSDFTFRSAKSKDSVPSIYKGSSLRRNKVEHIRVTSAPPNRMMVWRGFTSQSKWKKRSRSAFEFRRRSTAKAKKKLVCKADTDRFGEIGFLKNKLGFILPSAEETVKSWTYKRCGPNTPKPLGLFHYARRVGYELNRARNIYTRPTATDSRISSDQIIHSRNRTILSLPLSVEFPFSHKSTSRFPYNMSRKPLKRRGLAEINRNRHSVMYDLNLFIKNVAPFDSQKKLVDNSLLYRVDGTVRSITKEEIVSYYQKDEDTLKLARSSIAADRRKTASQMKIRRDEKLSNRFNWQYADIKDTPEQMVTVKEKQSMESNPRFYNL